VVQVIDSSNPSQNANATLNIFVAPRDCSTLLSVFCECRQCGSVFIQHALQQEVSRRTHGTLLLALFRWAFLTAAMGQFLAHQHKPTSGIYDSSGDSASHSARANLSLNVLPELPRHTVDTSLPTKPVHNSGECGKRFAASINAAQCGSTIKVQAGATFVGGFVFS